MSRLNTFAGISNPISIKDIARAAKVSHSTVSRALQHSPLVKQETAERVRRIARQHGYAASAAARTLVTKKSRAIGVVVTTIADPFTSEIVSGIEEVANDHRYSVFLANSQADPEREVRVVRSLQEWRVDGILVTSSRVGALYLPLLSEMKVPIVLINSQHPGQFVHSVRIADVKGAYEATGHLIQLGHRRIAYLGDQFGFQSDTERLAGYRKALEEADIGFLPELVAYGDGWPEMGEYAMQKLLSLGERPTAVFSYNDLTALGALHAIHSCDLSVPRDISVVGFDDLFFAAYLQPPLTTIRQPRHAMGRQAMELLLKLLSDTGLESNVLVDGQLIVRQSTSQPGAYKGRDALSSS